MPVLNVPPLLSASIVTAFEAQIEQEMSAMLQYRAWANACRARAYRGSLKWLKAQSREELHHANKFQHFITGLNEDVSLPPGDAPDESFTDLPTLFRAAYDLETEQAVSLQKLSAQITAEGNLIVAEWVDQHLKHQRKELTELITILNWFDHAGNDEAALEMVDHKIGKKS